MATAKPMSAINRERRDPGAREPKSDAMNATPSSISK